MTAAPKKNPQLGILLVHGIGAQPSGESLVRWGDVLLRTISEATGHHVQVKVETAVRDGNADGPASASVLLRSGQNEERWLLADGWWADAFLPPSYRELVSWSVRALPWAIAFHFAQRFWQTARQNQGGPIIPKAIAITQLVVALLLAPLFVLLLGLTLLVGLLPVPQIRSLILAWQGRLTATVGDCLAFVESPVRAALIRTRILSGLKWLKEKEHCEKTIIVAHSQGAALVLDALGAIGQPMEDGFYEPNAETTASDLVPETLLTFGAGTNQLAGLKRLSMGLSSQTFSMGDLRNLPSFVRRLNQAPKVIDQFIRDQLSVETKAMLSNYHEEDSDQAPLKRALVRDLNRFVRGSLFYDVERFMGVDLGSKTQQLLSENAEAEDMRPLNRLLLERAYPRELTSIASRIKNPVAYATWAILALVGIVAWLCVTVLLHSTTVTKILLTLGGFIACITVFLLIAFIAEKLLTKLGKRCEWIKNRATAILVTTLTVLFLLGIGPLIFFAQKSALPIFPVLFAPMAVIALVGGISHILSKETMAGMTMVTAPTRLRRWIDLFASADPVPNGPTRTVETGSAIPKYDSIRIWNQGSSLADHTAYWHNLDGFVLRVVRACAETAESPWKDKLPQESSDVDERAKWRVSWLRLARLTVGLSWLLTGAALWLLHRDDVPLPVTLPRWLPTIAATLARLGVLATGTALAAWGSFGILRVVWGAWVRREQKKLLARQPPGNEFMPLVGVGIVVWSILCVAYFAARDEFPLPADLLFGVFCFVVSPAFLSTLVLLHFRPPPKTAQAKPHGSQLQPTLMKSPES